MTHSLTSQVELMFDAFLSVHATFGVPCVCGCCAFTFFLALLGCLGYIYFGSFWFTCAFNPADYDEDLSYYTDSEAISRPSQHYRSNRKLTLVRNNSSDKPRSYQRSISAVERLGLSTPPPTRDRDRGTSCSSNVWTLPAPEPSIIMAHLIFLLTH